MGGRDGHVPSAPACQSRGQDAAASSVIVGLGLVELAFKENRLATVRSSVLRKSNNLHEKNNRSAALRSNVALAGHRCMCERTFMRMPPTHHESARLAAHTLQLRSGGMHRMGTPQCWCAGLAESNRIQHWRGRARAMVVTTTRSHWPTRQRGPSRLEAGQRRP
jgi:hypothetical protein